MATKKSGWEKWREKKLRDAKKKVKKAHWGYIVIAVLFLAIGVAGGYYAAQYVPKNDCFELNGIKEMANVIGVSNNHVLDHGYEGFVSTLKTVNKSSAFVPIALGKSES